MPILFNSKTDVYAWLSNFWQENFTLPTKNGELVFLTAEGAYQYAKLPEANRTRSMADMYRTKSGVQAKNIAKGLPLREDWESAKVEAMQHVLRWKFAAGTPLLAALMKTGEEELVHYCPWGDTFWGVDKSNYGLNMLGKLLMARRQEVHNIQRTGIVSR